MDKGILKRTALAAIFGVICIAAAAQTTFGGVLQIDRTVQDWGDVTVKDGPLSCSFTVQNVSNKDIQISSVVSSCGCTGVKWTREVLRPGQSGTIDATYSNDEGAHAFDKTLSVYLDGVRKPLILHLRGVVHKKKLPLAETYPIHMGDLALRKSSTKIGNLSQGEQKSTQITLANISKKTISVSFKNISDGLSISPAAIEIAGQSTATVTVTVTADRSRWGKNLYFATPVVNGSAQEERLEFTAITKDNFDNLDDQARKLAPKADYEGSVAPEPVKAGEPMKADFSIRNKGKKPLHIWRIDFDSNQLEKLSPAKDNATIAPGSAAKLSFNVKTAQMRSDSDNLFVVTLYTDDPEHSVINLYIDAIIL